MSETKKSERRPLFAKWVWWVGGALVGALVLLLTTVLVTRQIGRTALAREIERIRETGGALTYDDLLASIVPVPDEENSALVILELADKLSAIREGQQKSDDYPWLGRAEVPDWPAPWPNEMNEKVDEFLTLQEALLAKLDVTADMPRGSFGRDYSGDPMLVLLPDLSDVRTAAKIIVLAAERDARQGNMERAAQRLITALNIGHSLEDDPFIISMLAVAAVNALTVEAMEYILTQHRFDGPTLERLQRAYADREAVNLIARGLSGERVAQLAYYDYVRRYGIQTLSSAPPGASSSPKVFDWALAGLVDMNEAKTLELITPLVEAADSYADAIGAAKKMEAVKTGISTSDVRYHFARILMPSLYRACELSARCAAIMRCTVTALAMERYRLAHGAWPESLDDLVPEYLDSVPIDPFDEKPMRYATKDGYVVIYSVGEHGVDDGGDVEKPAKKQGRSAMSPDTGFRLLSTPLESD